MKCNRDDVDKYKASEESKSCNVSAFIVKKQDAVETAPVNRVGLEDQIQTFVQKLCLTQEMPINKNLPGDTFDGNKTTVDNNEPEASLNLSCSGKNSTITTKTFPKTSEDSQARKVKPDQIVVSKATTEKVLHS